MSESMVAEGVQARPGDLSVCFVDASGWPGGGQLSADRYLAKSAATSRHLIVSGLPEGFPLSVTGDVRIHRMPPSKGFRGSLRFARMVSRELRSIRPDVVVANSWKTMECLSLLPRSRRYRLVGYMRTEASNSGSMRRWRRFALALSLRLRYDAIIANSRFTASTLPKRLTKKTRVAYPVSGLEGTPVHTPSLSEPIRILSLSRLDRWKGIDVLLDAVEILERRWGDSAFRLEIAGSAHQCDADYESELRVKARRLSSSVEFIGHVSDVGPLLRSSHILAHCSVTPEPFGQVIVQGMAHGLFVVATAHGGPSEMIRSGLDGVLVRPRAAEDLANALELPLVKADFVERVRKAAIDSARRFSDAETVPALDRILREVVSAGSGSSGRS